MHWAPVRLQMLLQPRLAADSGMAGMEAAAGMAAGGSHGSLAARLKA